MISCICKHNLLSVGLHWYLTATDQPTRIAKLSRSKLHKTRERDTVLVTFSVSRAELGKRVIWLTHMLASIL
jgi:hypothetical protein